MKAVGFNGSPKKKGNTYHAIKLVFDELEKEGIETEIIHVGSSTIQGCMGCGKCAKNQDEKCIIKNDNVNEWVQTIKTADGLLLGSPVHYSAMAGVLKTFLDRAFMVGGVNNSMFRHKVGASVAAVRRSGGLPTINQMNHFLCYSEMMMPTSNYWNVIHGMTPGEVLKDEEGVQIMRVLGKNMAYLMKIMDHAKEAVAAPEREDKVMTNFIR